MREKNYAMEFLRVVFTLGVIVGHTFCIFYQKNDPSYVIYFQNTCVDFFFILSGFLMAAHFGGGLKNYKNDGSGYAKYTFSRIKRLYPLLLIGILTGILYDGIFDHAFNHRNWATFFFLSSINNFAGWGDGVLWYISVLFWGGVVVSGLLCFAGKKAVYVYFPVIIFVSLSIMNIFGHCSLNTYPLILNWFSSGILRGLCGLSIGVEAFFIATYIKKHFHLYKTGAIKFFSIFIELSFISIVCYLALKQKLTNKEFLIYFTTPALLIVLHLKQSVLFKCVEQKIFGKLGPITAIIYVTHIYVIKVLHNFFFIRELPDFYVYIIIIAVISFFVGWIIFLLENKIERFFARHVLAEVS